MTHEELLAICDNYSFKDSAEPVKALRAVVELHKPWAAKQVGINANGEHYENYPLCCGGDHPSVTAYPCPTIQAIEKELA